MERKGDIRERKERVMEKEKEKKCERNRKRDRVIHRERRGGGVKEMCTCVGEKGQNRTTAKRNRERGGKKSKKNRQRG